MYTYTCLIYYIYISHVVYIYTSVCVIAYVTKGTGSKILSG